MANGRPPLPYFERTSSPTKDIFQLERNKVIAWGSYTGKFNKLYRQLAGTHTVNGILCYKHKKLTKAVNSRGSKEYKFLKHIGFEKKDLNNLREAIDHEDVDFVELAWKKSQEISEETFVIMVNEIKDQLTNVDKISLTHSALRYNINIIDENARVQDTIKGLYGRVSGKYNHDENEWVETGLLGKEKISMHQVIKTAKVELYDSNGIDISNEYNDVVKGTILSILLKSNEEGFEYLNNEKTSELSDGLNHVIVETKENWNADIIKDFEINEYSTYEDKQDIYELFNESIEGSFQDTYKAEFWKSRDFLVSDDIGGDSTYFEQSGGLIYLRVDGIKGMGQHNFPVYMATFLDIKIKEKDKNWFDKFLAFLARFLQAILDLIGFVFDMMMYFPVFRLMVEGLASLYRRYVDEEATYEESMEIIKNAIVKITFSVALMFATGGLGSVLSGSASFMQSLTAVVKIINLGFDVAEQIQDETDVNKEEREEAKKKLLAEQPESMKDTVELNGMGDMESFEKENDILFNKMFNVLDILGASIKQNFIPRDEFNKNLKGE